MKKFVLRRDPIETTAYKVTAVLDKPADDGFMWVKLDEIGDVQAMVTDKPYEIGDLLRWDDEYTHFTVPSDMKLLHVGGNNYVIHRDDVYFEMPQIEKIISERDNITGCRKVIVEGHGEVDCYESQPLEIGDAVRESYTAWVKFRTGPHPSGFIEGMQ